MDTKLMQETANRMLAVLGDAALTHDERMLILCSCLIAYAKKHNVPMSLSTDMVRRYWAGVAAA